MPARERFFHYHKLKDKNDNMIFSTLTISMRATWHPSVPAPRRRHFMEDKASKFRDGKARHLISFKFKSAADMANLIRDNNTKL